MNGLTREPLTRKEQLDLINDLHEIIDRTKAINQVVENNLIEESTTYKNISDRVATLLCFQTTENLEQMEGLVEKLTPPPIDRNKEVASV